MDGRQGNVENFRNASFVVSVGSVERMTDRHDMQFWRGYHHVDRQGQGALYFLPAWCGYHHVFMLILDTLQINPMSL